MASGARLRPRVSPAAVVAPRRSRATTAPTGPVRVSLGGFGRAPRTRERDVSMQGLFGLGLPEVAVIAGVAAVLFGPSKLPELGKNLGKTVKSFQVAAKEFETELKDGEEATAAGETA